MPETIPIPGRVKPTRRAYDRRSLGASAEWRPPPAKRQMAKDRPGTLICARCHAISTIKRWFYDERRYQELKRDTRVGVTTCPGCERLDRQLYEGDVRLRSVLLVGTKRQSLAMIRHEEQKAMRENPIARLAAVHDQGAEITIFTTTRYLAERIGRAFERAFGGTLRVDRLVGEKFSRVYWERR
ncbi:MAG: hypothetical protein GEU73_01655 [Chloroflexi bacterium]|nr:hypothetical protein [Chloroflexota bacterium]